MPCEIRNNSNFDISEIEELIQNLFSFSQDRFGFQKPPVLNLMSDESNTSPLGRTAHYDPNSMEITIYVDGRHPKDIMRSFSHELVHHNQNENGMFNDLGNDTDDGYAQSNPHLRKMEKEAYLKGNMCFRDWEDGYKSSNPNILNERRIYKMSTNDWKNKELKTLLNEKWGFSMDLGKLNEACGDYMRDDEEPVDEMKIHTPGGKTKTKEEEEDLKKLQKQSDKNWKQMKGTTVMKEEDEDLPKDFGPSTDMSKLSDEEEEKFLNAIAIEKLRAALKRREKENKNPKEAKLRETIRRIIRNKLRK